MSEGLKGTVLEPITEVREEAGLKELPAERLLAQAGSSDPNLAEDSLNELREKWHKQPERDAQYAEKVDLVEQLESEFSEEEISLMLKNMVALQLTTGCNGGCNFCLFGKKKGVTEKYSFESLKTFFEKYGKNIEPSTVLYWDSDPFDYRDGDKSFVDVYNLMWEETGGTPFISTTIPKGGEMDLIKFVKYSMRKHFEDSSFRPNIRLSVGKHNVARVEATLKLLIDELVNDGFSRSQVDDFLFSTFNNFSTRFEEDVIPIGALIEQQDDLRDLATPACSDGILFSPTSTDIIMVTIPTIYEPSGQRNITLRGGGDFPEKIPMLEKTFKYEKFSQKGPIRLEREWDTLILPSIKTSSGLEYKLENEVDDLTVSLGRETTAIFSLLDEISEKKNKWGPSSAEYVFGRINSEYFSRRKEILSKVERAKSFVAEGKETLPDEDSEKIQFYILLTEVNLAKMDFVVDLIDDNEPYKLVSTIATLLQKVGREQVDELPSMVNIIKEILYHIRISGKQDMEINRQAKNAIMERIAKPFGYENENFEDLPKWIKGIVE